MPRRDFAYSEIACERQISFRGKEATFSLVPLPSRLKLKANGGNMGLTPSSHVKYPTPQENCSIAIKEF